MLSFWWSFWIGVADGLILGRKAMSKPGLEIIYRSRNVVFVRHPAAHRNSA
jgi:hypothetical protein